ncbi:AbrB/MazE/SpoVT family DNA-binding domain-containing protein [Sphingomonas sp. NPDC092331]|jgi:AbrB family transcriptional regulator, stage V sporulation protein T|uniref:AbrB/MazE/SpoVT family DNA-binding domain-containing protein n=1 Tax=unclassified Sphingomonas TaxID=196159 RepID=UPI0029EE396B|nr:AbrB/MazE/SpoVT family DNA-binding domain-containing protein [Pseudomonadota bacterium]
MTYQAKVIAGGKIVIPAELRRELGIKDGDVLVLDRAADGSLAIRTHMQVIREGQAAFRAALKQPFTVDEFIAEKRAEADRE